MTEPALAIAFFDPAHGLYGTVRAGMALLFEGAQPTALSGVPALERAGTGYRAALEGRFELELEPVVDAVKLGPAQVGICRVSGAVNGATVSCFGTASEILQPPAWEELDAVRSISAVFDEEHAVLATSRRPREALGHGEERTLAALLDEGQIASVEDARISTVYDGEGRQRSAGLELWLPGEEFPRRASGTAVAGSSLELEGLRVHVAVFRWRMEDREGSGAYELTVRDEPPAAA